MENYIKIISTFLTLVKSTCQHKRRQTRSKVKFCFDVCAGCGGFAEVAGASAMCFCRLTDGELALSLWRGSRFALSIMTVGDFLSI